MGLKLLECLSKRGNILLQINVLSHCIKVCKIDKLDVEKQRSIKMKRLAFTLTLSVLGISLAFGGQVNLQKDVYSSAVKLSLSKAIEESQTVKGLQFDMIFNHAEIKLNDASSLLDGFTFEYQVKEDGKVRGLIFSMDGSALNANDLSNILEFNFDPIDGFSGTSDIRLENVVVAGDHGENITEQFSIPALTVSFENTLPVKTSLSTNYPNPFNPSTTIPYEIKDQGFVSLIIYDLNGAEVRSLVADTIKPGSYQAVWNGLNNSSQPVASGRYIVKMSAPDFTDTVTMTLLK